MSDNTNDSSQRSVSPRSSGNAPTPFNKRSDAFSDSWDWDIVVSDPGEGKTCTCSLMVGADDNASLNLSGVGSVSLGPRDANGGGMYEERNFGPVDIAPGTYRAHLDYTNISLPPGADNAAILNYSITIGVKDTETGETTSSYVPEEETPEPIDEDDEGESTSCPAEGEGYSSSTSCPCPEDMENGDGNNGESGDEGACDDNPGGDPPVTRSSGSAALSKSSAGRRVTAQTYKTDMQWGISFGTFRGMSGMPSGSIEILGKNFSSALWTPAALSYNHPMSQEVVTSGSSSSLRNAAFQIKRGGTRLNAFGYGDGTSASLIAGSAKRGGMVRMVSASSASETGEKAAAASMDVFSQNGSVSRLSIGSGVSSYTSRNKAVYSSADFTSRHSIIRDSSTGAISQMWNKWDGLAQVEDVTDTGYRLSLYLPGQVGAKDAVTGRYSVSGEAFKRYVFSRVETESGQLRLSIVEQTPGRADFRTCYWQGADGMWNMSQGEGEDMICTLREKTILSDTTWRLITRVQRGETGTPVSCVCETYSKTYNGNLCTSRIEGYGTDHALETTYEYNGQGKKSKETTPDGSVRTWSYDEYGREIVNSVPWAGGGDKATYTYYCDNDSPHPDISYQRVVLTNTATQLTRTDYSYEETDSIRRVTSSAVALGAGDARTTVKETWLSTVTNTHARGRLRMTQAINGVQTWYEYEATTQYDALYKVTAETKVGGELVNGQSTRTVTYVSAEGNNMRTEEYVLLSNGEWAQTEGITYEYDSENRWTKRTRDNGRVVEREMMCCGPLWLRDEDGVLTSYSYNTARQLIETIRSETPTTPETITTYTRDAAGRVVSLRRDVGAMTTQRSTTYDLCGRVTQQTDELGRVTSITYSANNLTSTRTTPTGATHITETAPDGSVLRESGTGQRERQFSYDSQGTGVRVSVRLADGETLLGQRIMNGFGEVFVKSRASSAGFIYDRSTYNSKGQLTRLYSDTGWGSVSRAATTKEYDSFGNLVREVVELDEAPTLENSPITTYAYSRESRADGVYTIHTETRNNAAGGTYAESTATLISAQSSTLESKTIITDPRGNSSTEWVEYGTGTQRVRKSTIPTSSLTATTTVVDGFTTEQTDHVGITATQTRSYSSTGITLVQTDGRGNSTTTVTDIAGRVTSVTDATGASTATAYDAYTDNPATIANALGKTRCYRYDIRGRKIAEWGTAIQPACYGYDDADRLVSLTTFRADAETIESDPTDRADGDTTTWTYHDASGAEVSKTYADGNGSTKTYDSFLNIATETDARNVVKTHSYEAARGLLLGTTYSDGTTARSYVYNHLSQLTQVTDDAGTRALTYNEYAELSGDAVTADGQTDTITENQDTYGRSLGFIYEQAGVLASAEQYTYGTDGRLNSAAFSHGEAWHTFSYGYLTGSNLLQTLTMPNGMTLTQQFETQRDLLTGMEYKRGTSGVVERYYTYDSLGRPLTRQQNRNGGTRSDSFTHNDRSELTAGILGTKGYYYTYDNIGNRKTAKEDADEATNYDANNLNQYTAVGDFAPTYDAAGNQTRVQTGTGIWEVTYNAENRPIVFLRTNEDGTQTRVSCVYDFMGRRATKKVETLSLPDAETGERTATTTLHQRYLYRGYLQIACRDLTRENHPSLWFITWDPTQPVATRPLAIRKDGTWYCYGWDLTKNICEVFSNEGRINNTVIYSYTPYGAVTAEGTVTQPIQWSSEFYDEELGLVYYNYRYYCPFIGRWIGRDMQERIAGGTSKLYLYTSNRSVWIVDSIGNSDSKPYLGNGTAYPPKTFTQVRLELSNEALNWVKENCKCFRINRDKFGLSETEGMAVIMAMAEEYSAKTNPFHRIADYIQDRNAAASGGIITFGPWLRPDVGPGNMNLHTALKARNYIREKATGISEQTRREMYAPFSMKNFVSDSGNIMYASAEMRRITDAIESHNFFPSDMSDADIAQNLSDIWREGDKRIDRMKENAANTPNYRPQHRYDGDMAQRHYDAISDILKNCDK